MSYMRRTVVMVPGPTPGTLARLRVLVAATPEPHVYDLTVTCPDGRVEHGQFYVEVGVLPAARSFARDMAAGHTTGATR